MYKSIAIALLILIGLVMGVAAVKPDNFRVQRSAEIKAPLNKIFLQINDFHNWALWSPYEKLDPSMKKRFSGPVKGKGSVYNWEGNSKAGSGSMQIIESDAPVKLIIKLEFLKPAKSENNIEFTLRSLGENTEVTWAMYGKNSYMAKLLSIFYNMDTVLGNDFNTGLAKLKENSEK
jgi:hypothetical protein